MRLLPAARLTTIRRLPAEVALEPRCYHSHAAEMMLGLGPSAAEDLRQLRAMPSVPSLAKLSVGLAPNLYRLDDRLLMAAFEAKFDRHFLFSADDAGFLTCMRCSSSAHGNKRAHKCYSCKHTKELEALSKQDGFAEIQALDGFFFLEEGQRNPAHLLDEEDRAAERDGKPLVFLSSAPRLTHVQSAVQRQRSKAEKGACAAGWRRVSPVLLPI